MLKNRIHLWRFSNFFQNRRNSISNRYPLFNAINHPKTDIYLSFKWMFSENLGAKCMNGRNLGRNHACLNLHQPFNITSIRNTIFNFSENTLTKLSSSFFSKCDGSNLSNPEFFLSQNINVTINKNCRFARACTSCQRNMTFKIMGFLLVQR